MLPIPDPRDFTLFTSWALQTEKDMGAVSWGTEDDVPREGRVCKYQSCTSPLSKPIEREVQRQTDGDQMLQKTGGGSEGRGQLVRAIRGPPLSAVSPAELHAERSLHRDPAPTAEYHTGLLATGL